MDNNNILTRNFTAFTDYLISQYGNLPVDTKPRGGNAYNIQRKGNKGKGKSKGDKGKGKPAKSKGRSGERLRSFIGTSTTFRHQSVSATTIKPVPLLTTVMPP
jgi:hypothetical protein